MNKTIQYRSFKTTGIKIYTSLEGCCLEILNMIPVTGKQLLLYMTARAVSEISIFIPKIALFIHIQDT